jgi:hypothetical protein
MAPEAGSGATAFASLTIGDAVAIIAPGMTWRALCDWPPDVFAATSAILADSGAYRSVVCPPEGRSWPPVAESGSDEPWEILVPRWGVEWADRAAGSPGRDADTAGGATVPADGPPSGIARFAAVLDEAADSPVTGLDEPSNWPAVTALLGLHATADEACVGAGLASTTRFQRLALSMLDATGSLSRLPTDRVRVLPKLRPPESGITLRSISHNLAFDRSEVRTTWVRAPAPLGEALRPQQARLTLLLVPFPSNVHANDFRPVRGPILNMDQGRYGFFEYAPTEPLELDAVIDLAESAQRRVGSVHALVLPEAALDEAVVPVLQERLAAVGVPYLIAGVRRSSTPEEPFATNYAYIGGAGWHAAQHKHHRWRVGPSQVHQYHLGAALEPNHQWWEAIRIRRRSLTFVTTTEPEGLTICPLVCEDLARPDPVTDVIRAVAPTLVVGLLLDGPQLAARWPARYASVLADDPGSSVLTLTALGMCWRSQPSGFDPSRVIALWKDPHRGLQQIALAEDARAVALTAHRREVHVDAADGRSSTHPVTELVLSGLEQIA